MANRNHERIEKWLDAALDWYSSAEPRPGVENRVLARVRAEREKHATRRWLLWGVAGVTAVAAVVLIAVVLTLRPGSPPKQVAGPVPISPARAAIACARRRGPRQSLAEPGVRLAHRTATGTARARRGPRDPLPIGVLGRSVVDGAALDDARAIGMEHRGAGVVGCLHLVRQSVPVLNGRTRRGRVDIARR